MAVRVKGLIAFVLAVAFIVMTMSSIFPHVDEDRAPDIIAPHADPFAQAHEDAGSEHHHTTTVPPAIHQTPHQQQPASPISEWEIIEPPARESPHDVAGLTAAHGTPDPDLPTQNKDFRILIGVMNPFHSGVRRSIMRNAYNRFPKDLPVDVWFVMGNVEPWNPGNAEKVMDTFHVAREWENDTHHDILDVDCVENMEEGKTYEYFKKVGREFSDRYTHVMKTDDDSFVNVIREHKDEAHFYWGATYTDGRFPSEMWGSGYVLSMDLVTWISTSEIPINNTIGLEDLQVAEWLVDGGLNDNAISNLTAFAGYPWPELGDHSYKQENEIRPFERWTLVTHPLKENFMWIDTANYYLNLKW